MITTFQMVLQLCEDAVGYQPFVEANSVLQDSVTKEAILARIAALRPVYTLEQTFADSLPSLITGGVIMLDYGNRQFTIPTTSPTGESRIVFNPFPGDTTPPLRIRGFLLSPDTTLLETEMELDYRTPNLSPTDPWKRLLQQDMGVYLPVGVQFSVLIPNPPGSDKILKTIHILADQV